MVLVRVALVMFLALAAYALPAPDTKTSEDSVAPTNPPIATGPITAEGSSVPAEDTNSTGLLRNPGFSCEGRIFGYYGDPANCSLFHYCEPFVDPESNQFVLHAAYLCPNETVFNQLSLTCAYPGEALPCERAPEYYYINSHVVPADSGDNNASSTEASSTEAGDAAATTAVPEAASTEKAAETKQ
ncbi:uncharacterized protein LOC135370203 [Ornithodoros turicata]|uniref:uncharacterized protein LOC135370203 n=1 Tax=Ornithodoros turicata TaxID=34597 RepID=UPI0031397B3E